MSKDLAAIWTFIAAEIAHPDTVWQLGLLAACLLLAKLIEVALRRRARPVGSDPGGPGDRRQRAWALGRGGVKRVAFPLVAGMLVLAARAAAQSSIHTPLLSLAIPLLFSLAAIRMVFFALRHSFVQSAWLTNFERFFAVLVWCLVALHITGLLPELIDVLEAIKFPVGKSRLSLWQVIQGVVTVAVTMLGALWVGGIIESRLAIATGLDGNMRAVLARVARALLVLVAVLISLPLVGIDLTTLSVFGGALGVGLGFGLQKIASNYVSGFILLLDHSIRIGNMIAVEGQRGEVTRITTRYTVVRNLRGVESLVPNELLVGSIVQNESYSDRSVRVALSLQVSYDSDLERAMAIMIAAAKAQPRVLASPEPIVLLDAFAESGINLELGFWIDDPQEGTGQLRSDINMKIWRDFKPAGISIPFPRREVRIIGNSTNGAFHG